jgi:hypothetical protein
MREDEILDMVNEMLDCEGDVVIGNLTFTRSEIVRNCDPIAYSIIVNEMVDNMIADLEYDLDRLDPELDADEVEDLQERIEYLQDYSY